MVSERLTPFARFTSAEPPAVTHRRHLPAPNPVHLQLSEKTPGKETANSRQVACSDLTFGRRLKYWGDSKCFNAS
jgi:hypothetical protein